jgi:NHLM bacteriocin system ABC transporter peptidase/ATP-binding protein
MSIDFSRQAWTRKRVRVPTILQMEITECGAACLAMVLAHFRRHVPLERLRVECGVSRDGSNAKNLLRAARSHGMDARAYRVETHELHSLPLPLILYWEFRHFVVLEGRKGDTFFINDPASGPRRIDAEEFDTSFTGVALRLEPAQGFAPSGSGPSLLKGLLKRVAPMKGALFFIIAASILLAAPGLIIPSLARIFVDEVLGPNPQWLAPLLLALAGSVVMTALMTWLQRMAVRSLTIGFLTAGSSAMFHHLLRLPMEFFMQRDAGDIQYRIELNDLVAEMLSGSVGQALTGLFLMVFYAALLFAYDVPLTLVGLGMAGLGLLALTLVARRRTVLNQSLMQEKCKLMGMTMADIQLMETIKATASEQESFARWSGQQARDSLAEQRMSFSTILVSALPVLLAGLNTAVVLLFGAWRVINGEMTMGMLVAFQMLMAAFLAPVVQLSQLGAQIQEARGALDKLDDVAEYPLDPAATRTDEPGCSDPSRRFRGELELQSVSFGYSPVAAPLLRDFSLRIRPGQRVAVVGRSGSGKSTVAKLAAGLYQPWSGQVLYDGIPLDQWPRADLAGTMAMVDQDIVLFRDSLRDNLSLWNPLMDEEDMIQACRDAEIHAEIANRAGGYGAMLTEDGGNFSGGQRQRLEIARALADNPALLILDEATSALDPEVEHRVDNHIRRRGCSCLIVAHRLSTIRDCDEIIVLVDGLVVQRGIHEELIQDEDGAYARLIKAG